MLLSGMAIFRTLRWAGSLWVPAAVRHHLSDIGFYENTVRKLNPTLPPVSVRAALGLAKVWPPDHASLRQADIEDGVTKVRPSPVTAAH